MKHRKTILLLLICLIFGASQVRLVAAEVPQHVAAAGQGAGSGAPADSGSAGSSENGGSGSNSGDELQLIGKSAVLIDAATGKILYEKNKDELHYPASTTKIMTSILAIENLDLTENVPIDAETPFTEGSRIYLLEDEVISGEEVMYGMMLESANDAAVAFAKKISGSVEEFAKLMNEKAREVGAKNTNFVNPNGLHEDEHVSTAYDLAMMARYAMQNETFRKYVSTYQHTIPATNKQDIRYLYNTNRLLYDNKHKVTVNGEQRGCKYDGVTGIKTGYTSHAQGCLVAGAQRNGTELIAVVMASTDMGRFQDCITMLDYGFANFKSVNVLAAGSEMGEVPVKRGSDKQVAVALSETANVVLPAEASEKVLRTETQLYDSLAAPVKSGQEAGVMRVFAGEELLGEFPVITTGSVEEGGILSLVGISDSAAHIIGRVLLAAVISLLVLLTVYVLLKRHQVKVRKRRRLERQERIRRQHESRKAAWEQEYWSSRPPLR